MIDTERLYWLQEHPEFTLRKHKNMWSCTTTTSYPYNVYMMIREAIDAAINNTWQED